MLHSNFGITAATTMFCAAYAIKGQEPAIMKKTYLEAMKDAVKPAMLATMLGYYLEHSGALNYLIGLSISLMQAFGAASISQDHVASSRNSDIVVGVITQAHFETAYRERTPLDRCQMQVDFQSIIEQKPSILLIDIDLSPVIGESPTEALCQKKLDETLDNFARTERNPNYANAARVVLLDPFTKHSASNANTVQQWKEKRHLSGIRFSPGDISSSWGISLRYVGKTQFADFANQDNKTERKETSKSNPYNFKALLENPPDSFELPLGDKRKLADKIIFVGGTWTSTPSTVDTLAAYGGGDQFLTPIGVLDGVFLHAAKLVSLRDPINFNLFLHLAIDFIAGFLLAIFSHYFFTRFTHSLRERNVALGDWLFSYSLYVMFAILYCGFCIIVSYYFLREYGQLTYPFVIVLFLLVDALVIHPVEAFAHTNEAHVKNALPVKRSLFRALDFTSCITALKSRVKTNWMRDAISAWIIIAFFCSFGQH